jgi:hypothetical protein
MKYLKRLLFAIYLVVATCLLLEVSVRFWGYSAGQLYDPIYMPFSEEIPFVHKPNLLNARARGLTVINTDSLGLRSVIAGAQYAPKDNNEYRIAITGDSYTFGQGVKKTEETFCYVLEEMLNKRRSSKVRVLNFGASAYSVKEMAATLRERMLKVNPNMVVMAIIPGDLNLLRIGVVDRWGYNSDRQTSKLIDKDSYIRFLLRKVHLSYLLQDIYFQFFTKDWKNQNGAIHKGLPDSYKYILQFKENAEQHNLKYFIVILPILIEDKSTVTILSDLIIALKRDKVNFVNLETLSTEFTQDQFMASKFDNHPSAVVHKRIAESLSEPILRIMEDR